MPFAGYKNFAACVRANKEKRNPHAYCATIMRAVEKKEHEIEIDNHMHDYGRFHEDGESRKIKINVKKGDVVNTIIHEKLHMDQPEMSEREVCQKSHKIEGEMSLSEMANLLKETEMKAKTKRPEIKTIRTYVSKILKQNIKR